MLNFVNWLLNTICRSPLNSHAFPAYQPLQMAAVAYEVCKILVPANKAEKYKASFVKKVVNPLEKNVVNVVNPAVDREDCQYKKLEYNLCSSLTRFRVDEGKTPDGTPKKTTR